MDFDKLCAKYADLIEIEEMIFDIGECDIAKLFNKVKTAMKKYNIHPNYYQKMIDHASINYPQYLYQYWTLFQLIRYEFDYLISCINLESDLKKAYYREYGLIKKYQSDELPIPSFSECFSHYPKSGIIHSIMEDKSKTIKKFIEKNAAEEEDWDEWEDYKLIDWSARFGSEKFFKEFSKVCEPTTETLNFAILGRNAKIYRELMGHFEASTLENIIVSHNFQLFLDIQKDYELDLNGLVPFIARNYNLKMFLYSLCHAKSKTNAFIYYGYIQVPEIYEYFCQQQKPTNRELLEQAEQSDNVSLIKILLDHGMEFDPSDLSFDGHILKKLILPDSFEVYKYVFNHFDKKDLPVHFI